MGARWLGLGGVGALLGIVWWLAGAMCVVGIMCWLVGAACLMCVVGIRVAIGIIPYLGIAIAHPFFNLI